LNEDRRGKKGKVGKGKKEAEGESAGKRRGAFKNLKF